MRRFEFFFERATVEAKTNLSIVSRLHIIIKYTIIVLLLVLQIYSFMITTKELDRLIDFFIQNERAGIERDLNNYKSIRMAANARGADNKKHSHQRRIKPVILKKFALEVESKATQLELAGSFEEIYEIVRSCKVQNIGPLAIYDTSVRIAHIFHHEPQDVYLQRGAAWGARALGIRGSRVPKREFVKINSKFEQLKPHEIECFLCLHHRELHESTNAPLIARHC